MAQCATTSNVAGDKAHVIFLLQAPDATTTVHLLGSWDNFSSPILMKRDIRVSSGLWKVCLGSSMSSGNTPAQRGLKMGARYTYYFMIDGHLAVPDPTVTEKQSDPRTGMICSVFYVPVELGPGEQITVGGRLVKQKLRPTPLELTAWTATKRYLTLPGDIPFDKPAPSPTRANAPLRPTVIIPLASPAHCEPSSTSSSIPSLTPSSSLASATSPSSAKTPISPFRCLSKGDKRKGFSLKTPIFPCLPNILGCGSEKKQPRPKISNPIPINLDQCEGLRYVMMETPFPLQQASRLPQVETALTEEFERCTISRASSIESSPSLTQSEFSIHSSDSDTSSISSSPMSDCSDSDFEIDDDECMYSTHVYTAAATLSDDMEDAENWYRTAAKPRYSARLSTITYISDESQDVLGSAQTEEETGASSLHLPTNVEDALLYDGLLIYAPVPTRPCALLDVQEFVTA